MHILRLCFGGEDNDIEQTQKNLNGNALLAREEKDDRFFFREDGSWLGNFYNKGASYKPIAELRREWGLE